MDVALLARALDISRPRGARAKDESTGLQRPDADDAPRDAAHLNSPAQPLGTGTHRRVEISAYLCLKKPIHAASDALTRRLVLAHPLL
jgi:hypothetical protein